VSVARIKIFWRISGRARVGLFKDREDECSADVVFALSLTGTEEFCAGAVIGAAVAAADIRTTELVGTPEPVGASTGVCRGVGGS